MKFIFLFKRKIFILFLLGLLSSGFYLIGPYFSKLFIDKSFLNKDLNAFFKFSIAGGFLFLFSAALKALEDIVKNRMTVKVKLSLANRFIKKLYSLDFEFLQSKSVGENIYRLSNVDMIARLLVEELPRMFIDIFRLMIILVICLWINFNLTMVLLILSPLFFLQSAYMRRKINPIYEEFWKSNARLSKKISEAFSKSLIIKAFGLESLQRRSYIRLLIGNIRLGLKSFRWRVVSSLSSTFLSKAVFGVISLYGGWLIIKGKMSLGSYAAIMLYLNQAGSLEESISLYLEYFTKQGVALKKFSELIEMEPGIKDLSDAITLSSVKGEIQFERITFGYQQDTPVLKNLSFTIPCRQWVGLVGHSGCGKTTLANLIVRLYDPWEGEILLDGLQLKSISLGSLREKIAISTQEPILFDLSIRENINYGLKPLAKRQIENIGMLVQAHDFISKLPRGYDTLVGENAYSLSQGYKQRIALARAVARNPDILILDEATSSIDSNTEERILKALKAERAGSSTIIISHRLFSVRNADIIFFLRPDGMVEEGTHRQLLEKSNFYKEFFQNQLEEEVIAQ